MHQTTVRFSPDLWETLEAECSALGVSVAQYLREAAVARLSYTAGRRGDPDYEMALVGADVAPGRAETSTGTGTIERAHGAEGEAAEQRLASSAVAAQSRHVIERARQVREHAAEVRGQLRKKAS